MKYSRFWLILIAVSLIGTAVFAAKPGKQTLNKAQVLNYNMTTEPEVLDPARSTGLPESRVEYVCFEGLVIPGPHDAPRPGAAQKWTISPDGKTYTFYLRKNAKWSNGDPVTAKDFEYAWKRTLNPKTASEYASTLYYLKNAEEYNTGKINDEDQIGVKAANNSTLVVTLKAPCSYFLTLIANHAFYPVNRKVVEANPQKWASDPKTYVGNGPFKLVNWVHQEKLEFAPNPYYWNRGTVKLKKMVFYMVEEQSTALTMYESGQLDVADEIPRQEIPRLESEKQIRFTPTINTYYYLFNTRKAPFNDARVRKALSIAINREQIVKYVTKAGERPACAFVPLGVPDATSKTEFRAVGGAYFKDADISKAKKLLAEAGYSDIKKFPTIEILYNTSETNKQIAEAIQEMWSKQLGINVTLVNQEYKAYLQSRSQGNFQICRASWIGDYVDAMTFIDLWMKDNGNNYSGWSNAQYDKLLEKAKVISNLPTRMKLLHEAEKILMEEAPIAPIFFYSRPVLMKKWVKNVNYSATGVIDFTKAYIAAH